MRSRRHAGSIATALVLVIGMVGVQTHEAATMHVRCEAHGQLVHVTAPASPDLGGTNLLRTRTGQAAAVDHEHCALVGTTACDHVATTPAICVTVCAGLPPQPPAPADYVARATFRIAPKNSPPA
jgi:hypothetical protein